MTLVKWGCERGVAGGPLLHWIGKSSDNFPVKNYGALGAKGDLTLRKQYIPAGPQPPYQPLTDLGMWLSDGSSHPPAIDGGYDSYYTNAATPQQLEWTNNAFTISCWLFYAGLVNTPCWLVTKSANPDSWSGTFYSMSLRINSLYPSYRAQALIRGNADAEVIVTSASALTLGSWIYMAAVFNGTSLKIYQNGVESGSTAVTTSIKWYNHGPWFVGRPPWWEITAELPRGIAQDVRVRNVALTPAQIAEEYALPRFGS